jgi:AcrR family transcriptional regulator
LVELSVNGLLNPAADNLLENVSRRLDTAMPASKNSPGTARTADISKRHDRRERRREQSREEILAAARRLIIRNGIAATTLDAVAKEIGLSKAALYYYYPSKDALLFELIFSALETHSNAVREAVDQAEDGAAALGAVVRQTVKGFAPCLDDFRLAFLYGQLSQPGAVHFDARQFARIRPLNNLLLAGAAEKLARQRATSKRKGGIEPRLLAFLAYLAALGILTMKGMVESMDDPLVYSDQQLIEGFAQVFSAAVDDRSIVKGPQKPKVRPGRG